MGERRWWMDHVSEHGDVYDWLTDAEVLAEMDTHLLVRELIRRNVAQLRPSPIPGFLDGYWIPARWSVAERTTGSSAS